MYPGAEVNYCESLMRMGLVGDVADYTIWPLVLFSEQSAYPGN